MLEFRLFGIPVMVRPSFLLVAALLGLSSGRVSTILLWVAVVFFSILIHELGHALTARSFGSDVAIELNAVGGLTSWSLPDGDLGPGRRALVAAAGSAVGVAFGALLWSGVAVLGPVSGLAGFAVSRLIYVNLFWGLLNWLPLRPLDGGHLLVSLLEKVTPDKAPRIGNFVFLVSAAAGLAAALWFRLYFAALLAVWLLLGELNLRRPSREPMGIPPMTFDDAGSESLEPAAATPPEPPLDEDDPGAAADRRPPN